MWLQPLGDAGRRDWTVCSGQQGPRCHSLGKTARACPGSASGRGNTPKPHCPLSSACSKPGEEKKKGRFKCTLRFCPVWFQGKSSCVNPQSAASAMQKAGRQGVACLYKVPDNVESIRTAQGCSCRQGARSHSRVLTKRLSWSWPG